MALLPPCESWEVAGDDIRDPPPTLMPNFTAPQPANGQRRASHGVLLKRGSTGGEEGAPRDGRRNSVAKAQAPVLGVDLAKHPPPQPQQQQASETRDTRRHSLSKAAISAFIGAAVPAPSQAPLRPPQHTGGAGQTNATAPTNNSTRRASRFF